MRKEGNGSPEVCAENLMNTVRGECAHDRVKGINARIIDMPAEKAVKGDHVTMKLDFRLRPSDKVYKHEDTEYSQGGGCGC